MLADEPAEHLEHPGDHLVEIQHLRVDRLPAGERQELPRQVRGPPSRVQDVLQEPLQAPVAVDPFQGQLRVPDDHAEHVVEIMGDAPRETAHGLHLPRLDELRFEPLHLGQVDQ